MDKKHLLEEQARRYRHEQAVKRRHERDKNVDAAREVWRQPSYVSRKEKMMAEAERMRNARFGLGGGESKKKPSLLNMLLGGRQR